MSERATSHISHLSIIVERLIHIGPILHLSFLRAKYLLTLLTIVMVHRVMHGGLG